MTGTRPRYQALLSLSLNTLLMVHLILALRCEWSPLAAVEEERTDCACVETEGGWWSRLSRGSRRVEVRVCKSTWEDSSHNKRCECVGVARSPTLTTRCESSRGALILRHDAARAGAVAVCCPTYALGSHVLGQRAPHRKSGSPSQRCSAPEGRTCWLTRSGDSRRLGASQGGGG